MFRNTVSVSMLSVMLNALPCLAEQPILTCKSLDAESVGLIVTRKFDRSVGQPTAPRDRCKFNIVISDTTIIDQLTKHGLSVYSLENGSILIETYQDCEATSRISADYRNNSYLDDDYDYNNYTLSIRGDHTLLTAKRTINGIEHGPLLSFTIGACR